MSHVVKSRASTARAFSRKHETPIYYYYYAENFRKFESHNKIFVLPVRQEAGHNGPLDPQGLMEDPTG